MVKFEQTQAPKTFQQSLAEEAARLKAQQGKQQKVEEYKQTDKGKSWLRRLGEDIVKPFAEVGTAAYNVGESIYDLARGDVGGASEALEKKRNLPFVGETKPALTGSEAPRELAKKVGGYGAEIGSTFIGGGGAGQVGKQAVKGLIKQGLKTGVKAGVAGGAFGLGGRALQEDKSTGEILLNTALGAGGGAILGGALGAGLPAAGAGVRKILEPVETKVSNVIRNAIDKGIKPYFGNKVTATARNKYYQDAEKAFLTIFENRPNLTDEIGEEVSKLPTTRAEMLEALSKTKQAIYNKYHELAVEAGEGGAKFGVDDIVSQLDEVTKSKKYSPEIRSYAEKLVDDISELADEAPDVIEARIQDLNNSLTGFYEGRVSKAKAQVDASVAKLMREKLDNIIESVTGGPYQALKNKYGSLKTVEKDLTRQVALEARRNAKGLIDFTDIFTGGDLIGGAITGNPLMIAKGLAGRALKEYTKFINDPNRAIRGAFEILDNPPADIKNLLDNVLNQVNTKAGLSVQDVSDNIVRKMNTEDIGIMENFLDNLRSNKLTEGNERAARYLLDGMGINTEKNNQQIASIFEDLLNKSSKMERGKVITPEAQLDKLGFKQRDFNTPAVGKTASGANKKVTPDLQPLAQEAKKYKSAEEFIGKFLDKDSDLPSKTKPVAKTVSIDSVKPTLEDDRLFNEITKRLAKIPQELPPVIIDNKGLILDGNHRWAALKSKGFANIDVVTKSQLTDIWNKANKKAL